MKIEVNMQQTLDGLDAYLKSYEKQVKRALNLAGKAVAQEESKRTKGQLSKSFITKNSGNFTQEIVNTKPYAYFIENGRGPVFAKNGHSLKFIINGQTLFRKSVGPAKPQPFVDASIKAAAQYMGDIFLQEISKA